MFAVGLGAALLLAVLCGTRRCEAVELRTGSSGTNTYAEAIEYGKAHHTRDGDSWSGFCASLMWRAGGLPESSACESAKIAYERSKVVSKDINAFKQHLRDFLVTYNVHENEDNSLYYEEEKHMQQREREVELRQYQESIPGLLKPSELAEEQGVGDDF